MTSNSTEGKSDWSKNWWAEIAHAHAMKELGIGVSAEEKRINEIKGGVITSFVGIGVMVFLAFFLDVVANKNPNDAEIIRSLWMVGIIPFLVGISIIFNGLFISRRLVKLKEQQMQSAMPASQAPVALPTKTTDQLAPNLAQPAVHSVTEDPTLNLTEPVAAPTRREP